MPISCNFSTVSINALKWSVFSHPFDKTIVLIKKYSVCNHKYHVLSQLLDIFHVLHGMMEKPVKPCLLGYVIWANF